MIEMTVIKVWQYDGLIAVTRKGKTNSREFNPESFRKILEKLSRRDLPNGFHCVSTCSDNFVIVYVRLVKE